MFLDMDWLYLCRTEVYFYDKAIECLDDNGKPRVLQGKKKATSVRMVKVMQESVATGKGASYSQRTFLVIRVRRLRMQTC